MMIWVNLLGVGLIGLIVWWFWLYRPFAVKSTGQGAPTVITVENGVYNPSVVEAASQTPFKLAFLRKDPSPCADYVVFSALNLSEALPVNKKTVVSLPALAPGDYAFYCQMQMYRGTLRVV